MKILSNKYLIIFSQILLGAIFIFAGLEKIKNPELFAIEIENYRLFPIALINIIAITLPFLELFTGILLLFGVFPKENAFVITLLLAIFTLMVLIAIIRGLDINCGCFGTAHAEKVGAVKIIQNVILIFIGTIIYKSKKEIKPF